MNQTAQYRGSGSHQLVGNQAQQLQAAGFASRFPATALDNLNGVMIPTITSHQEHVHYQIMPPVTNSRNKIMVDVSTMTDPEEDEQNTTNWQNVNVPSNTKVAEYLSSLRQFLKDADGTKFRMDVTGGSMGAGSIIGSASGVGGTVGLVPTVKTSSGSSRRKEHRNDPNDVEHRPYGCAQCGKAFKRNEHLARHIVTHSGLKPHACIHCGKAFYRKDHLIKHAQSHTQPPRPKLPIP